MISVEPSPALPPFWSSFFNGWVKPPVKSTFFQSGPVHCRTALTVRKFFLMFRRILPRILNPLFHVLLHGLCDSHHGRSVPAQSLFKIFQRFWGSKKHIRIDPSPWYMYLGARTLPSIPFNCHVKEPRMSIFCEPESETSQFFLLNLKNLSLY